MGKKLTVTIKDEIDEELRRYIAKYYPKETYGKLSKIVNEALKSYLSVYIYPEV